MGLNVIITGATGMVGEGVLLGCLNSPAVDSVLTVNRKPCGITHNKLKELIVKDFFEIGSYETSLKGYNACFFCAGVSSVGKKEEEYRKITYDLTMNFASVLLKLNPGMTFAYVSGAGTNYNGKLMWAQVKGKTENDLMALPFRSSYMFRPGYIQPLEGQKNTYKLHKFIVPFYPLMEKFLPKYVISLKEIGQAMIYTALNTPEQRILECEDIRKTAGMAA